MTKVPPPMLGFNNNVRHQGRIFHIQTEDSGVKHPRIVTHLFADGGRIVKTSRTDYAEHIGRTDMQEVLRKLMKDQHKAMFIALRAGEFDDLIEQACGPAPSRAPAPSTEGPLSDDPPPSTFARSTPAVEPPAPPALESAAPARHPSSPGIQAAASRAERRSTPPPLPRRTRRSSYPRTAAVAEALPESAASDSVALRAAPPAAGTEGNVSPGSGRYAVSRPAAIFSEGPRPESRSIFGDNVSEKSLDEVILSYLAEDLEETTSGD